MECKSFNRKLLHLDVLVILGTDERLSRFYDWTLHCACHDSLFRCLREELLVGLGLTDHGTEINFYYLLPVRSCFSTVWRLVCILFEQLPEECHGVARVARSQIENLSLDEISKLFNILLQEGEVELVQGA